MSLARFVCLCALSLPAVGLFACSEDKSGETESELPANVVQEIGKEGGTLKAKGLTLEIPEGALDEKTSISITNRGKTGQIKLAKQVSDLYEFGPEGTTFKKDVRVTFEAEESEKELAVYFTKEGSREFERLSTEVEGDEVTAKTRHFSQGFVGEPLAAARPDGGGGGIDEDGSAAIDPDGGVTGELDASPGGDSDASLVLPTRISITSQDQYSVHVNQTWAAYQDGDGPWQLLEPTGETGIYTFDVISERYGVVFVCSDAQAANTYGAIHYEPATTTTLDVITKGAACTVGAEVRYNVSGTFKVSPDGQTPAYVYWRFGHAELTGAGGFSTAAVTYTENLGAGQTNDLLFGASADFANLSRILIQRDVTLTADRPNNDLDITNGFNVAGYAVAQVSNTGVNTTFDVRYATRGTEEGLLLNHGPVSGQEPNLSNSFALVPESVRVASDRYVLVAEDESSAGYRKATLSRYESADMSVTLPDAFDVKFELTDTPYTRPSYAFSALSPATKYTFSSTYAPTRTTSRSYTIEVNPAWLEGAAQELVFPDLSEVPGFNAAWVPPSPLAANVNLSGVVRSESTAGGESTTHEAGTNGTLPAPALGAAQ